MGKGGWQQEHRRRVTVKRDGERKTGKTGREREER